MSQTASPSDKTGKTVASPLAPPDERFWQRYSPHAELPLSSAGSFVMHVLVFGLLLLLSFLGTLIFHSSRSLPIETVQFGAGNGNPDGRGADHNAGGEPVEAGNPSNEKPAMDTREAIQPPKVDLQPHTPAEPQFEKQPPQQIPEEGARRFQSLREKAGQIRSPGSEAPSGSESGQVAPGPGGGKDRGTGSRQGEGGNPGARMPTKREERMLRWSMLFNTANSSDYVAQLRGLGAILAVPVREDAAKGICEYKVVRDLSTTRPAKFSDEDLTRIQRLVRWADDNPESVRGVMAVLRLNLKPSHFLAFMPEELEQKLLKLEKDHLNERHPGHKEDDIKATTFRIRVLDGKYEPEVIKQELK